MDCIEQVIAHLSWDDSNSIPVANAENKILINKLECIREDLTRKSCDLERNAARVKHFDRFKSQLVQQRHVSGQLIASQAKASVEKHNQEQLTRREIGRLKQALHQLENLQQTNLIKSRYLEQLRLELEKLSCITVERKNTLGKMYSRRQNSKLKLSAACQELTLAYQGRAELIKNCESVLNQAKEKEAQIGRIYKMVFESEKELTKSQTKVRETRDFFKIQQTSVVDCNKGLDAIVEASARWRQELSEWNEQMALMQIENGVLKRTIDSSTTNLEQLRAKVALARNEKSRAYERLDQLDRLRQQLATRLNRLTQDTLSIEQLVGEGEVQLTSDQTEVDRAKKQLTSLGNKQYKTNQLLRQVSTQTKELHVNIDGLESLQCELEKQEKKLYDKLLAGQEINYKQELSIHRLQQRISRLEGEKSLDLLEELKAKENGLQQEANSLDVRHCELKSQLAKLLAHRHSQMKQGDQLKAAKLKLLTRLEDEEHEIELAEKVKQKKCRSNRETGVEKNMVRLEVKRLYETCRQHNCKVFGLHLNATQLGWKGKELMLEAGADIKALTYRCRVERQEKCRLVAELHSRRLRVDQLVKRFEIRSATMLSEGDDTQGTHANYIIKAAQEKEETRRQGELLNQEIDRLEKELGALFGTARLMHSCNKAFKENRLPPTDKQSIDGIVACQTELDSLSVDVEGDERRKRCLVGKIEVLSDQQNQIDCQLTFASQSCQNMRRELEKANKEINLLRERDQRAKDRLGKLIKDCKSRANLDELREDISIRLTNEAIDRVISSLFTIGRNQVGLLDLLETELEKYEIVLANYYKQCYSRMATQRSKNGLKVVLEQSETMKEPRIGDTKSALTMYPVKSYREIAPIDLSQQVSLPG